MEEAARCRPPPVWRIILAFLIVPGAAALALATLEPAYDGLDSSFERVWRTAVAFGLFGAYPSAVLFGLPTLAVLYHRVRPTWLNCTLAGAFVASAPWALITLLGPSADQASIGGKATVIDGTTTAYGWLVAAQFVGEIALFGAAAGLLFWAIAASGRKTS